MEKTGGVRRKPFSFNTITGPQADRRVNVLLELIHMADQGVDRDVCMGFQKSSDI